jgi:hypothetical protein
VIGRRLVIAVVLTAQAVLLVRGVSSDHKELAWRMFPEASDWRADIVRVTDSGERRSIEDDWSGYRWSTLVPERLLDAPWVRRHADAGVDNQLAFLRSALDWVADNTPRDHETRYLEATVTYWKNMGGPRTVVYRSHDR